MKQNTEIIKTIIRELKKRNITQEQFRKDILPQNLSPVTKLRFLGTNNPRKYSEQDIVWFCYLFNLNPEIFGLEKSRYVTQFNREKVLDELEFHSVEIGDEGKKDFIEEYFQVLKSIVGRAEKNIAIYDLFGKRKGLELREAKSDYIEAHQSYLRAIEAALDEKELKYFRVMALSAEQREEEQKPLDRIVEICFVETFRHMYHCLLKYPKKEKFYIQMRPSRLFSFGAIDKNKIGIAEYDRLNYYGLFSSSTLFAYYNNSEEGEYKKIINHYYKEIKHNIKKVEAKISLRNFEEAADSLDDKKNLKEKRKIQIEKNLEEARKGNFFYKIRGLKHQLDNITEEISDFEKKIAIRDQIREEGGTILK